MPITAVTYDFWNTLAYEERGYLRGRRLEAWAGILDGAGFALERQQLESAMDSTWEAYVSSWRANQQFLAAEAAVHCVEQLGLEVPADVHTALVESFGSAGADVELHLTDHVADVLADLKERGIRLGIVCDVGFTGSDHLRAHLDRAGVLDLFDGWAFSDEVGVYKPDRRIFEHALAELGGVPPHEAAHIGDLRRTDIAGARAMGMTAIRYAGVFDDSPEAEERSGLHASDATVADADHVITDHRRLVEVVGLAARTGR